MKEVIDVKDNIKMVAMLLCGVRYDGHEYLLYSIKRNNKEANIFVSKLVRTSDGYRIQHDFDNGEKEILDRLVQRIINRESGGSLLHRWRGSRLFFAQSPGSGALPLGVVHHDDGAEDQGDAGQLAGADGLSEGGEPDEGGHHRLHGGQHGDAGGLCDAADPGVVEAVCCGCGEEGESDDQGDGGRCSGQRLAPERAHQEKEEKCPEQKAVESGGKGIFLVCANAGKDGKEGVGEPSQEPHDQPESGDMDFREVAAGNGEDTAGDVEQDGDELVWGQRLPVEQAGEQRNIDGRCVQKNSARRHAA